MNQQQQRTAARRVAVDKINGTDAGKLVRAHGIVYQFDASEQSLLLRLRGVFIRVDVSATEEQELVPGTLCQVLGVVTCHKPDQTDSNSERLLRSDDNFVLGIEARATLVSPLLTVQDLDQLSLLQERACSMSFLQSDWALLAITAAVASCTLLCDALESGDTSETEEVTGRTPGTVATPIDEERRRPGRLHLPTRAEEDADNETPRLVSSPPSTDSHATEDRDASDLRLSGTNLRHTRADSGASQQLSQDEASRVMREHDRRHRHDNGYYDDMDVFDFFAPFANGFL
ncbi:MAG: hypothetical protein MHM6MM_007843 [Cercozoa sp. M6MM]